jgi:fluoride ion exporter CrcB/FEX
MARMIEAKDWLEALGYSLGSVVVCVSMVFLGMLLMRKLLA